jgi:AcrR family transcriptional regulator
MQRPDESKRRQILDTAARRFAATPFHEVKLDDIAAAAKLGKGTLYIYFKSKEDLYVSMVLDGIDGLLAELQGGSEQPGSGAWSEVENIVGALLGFGRRYPHLYTLMRAGVDIRDARLDSKRAEVAALCERVIRRGVRAGEIADPHPALTAQYLLSFVRVALLYAPSGMSEAALRKHILRVLGRGIRGDSARDE